MAPNPDSATVPDVLRLELTVEGLVYAVELACVSGVCELRRLGEIVGGTVFHPDHGFRFTTPAIIPLLPALRVALGPYDAGIRTLQGRGSDPNLPILSKSGRRGAGLK